jgi:hypothetical protein
MTMLFTNTGGTGVETVFHQFLHNRAEVDNNLTRLDLVHLSSIKNVLSTASTSITYSPAFDGLYGSHGMLGITVVMVREGQLGRRDGPPGKFVTRILKWSSKNLTI